ncbi:MAG: 30S ribosomal protein S6 [Eubacteriales bacterium]|nr:30S ribosomal protein S6 [Eubacteriales bacterium]
MNRYELTYIIDIGLEDDARKELVAKYAELIKQNGGEIEKIDETWGKRRLAYAINDMWEGWYVLVTFQAPTDLPKEIERNLQINDKILRYLIIKLEEKKQSVKPRAARTMPTPIVVPMTPVAVAEPAAPTIPADAETPAQPEADETPAE